MQISDAEAVARGIASNPPSHKPPTPQEVIEKKARDEIAAFLAIKGLSDVFKSTRNLSDTVSDDYGDRVLLELIQNAHDAHPIDSKDGEIWIRLDRADGTHGALWVANKGVGFGEKEFRAITNLALSSKEVNAGAGNKGLGFRSVLQVSRCPEIYSCQGPARLNGRMDGYCFRFADQDEMQRLAGEITDQQSAAELAASMPLLFLPVPLIGDRSEVASRLADEGFASAIRLPLMSEGACERIAAQFQWLRALEAPVLLFLERISRITIEDSVEDRTDSLTRTVERLEAIDEATELAWVRVSGSDAYLVARRFLPMDHFVKVLAQSVQSGDVPRSWERWKGEAAVSVAVRLEGAPVKGRFYCFLPLGEEAASPFPGHCNANFYTSLDRRSIHEKCRLNDYFIDGVAGLCRDLARTIARGEFGQFPREVVDLISWDGSQVPRLLGAFKRDGGDLGEECLIPVEAPVGSSAWEAFRKCWDWKDGDYIALSATQIARSGGRVWSSALDAARRERLRKLGQWLVHSTNAHPSTVAEWVEGVADKMRNEGASTQDWENFLDDVAKRFAEVPSALAGKKFLPAVTGELVASEIAAQEGGTGEAKSVYFPRAKSETDESDDGRDTPGSNEDSSGEEGIPTLLNADFVFLSSSLSWADSSRRRRFLRANKMVRDFDSRELLRSLSVITRSPDREDSHRTAALRMAFSVWKKGRGDPSETSLAKLEFHVPSNDGWRIASSCTFGAGWGRPASTRLDRWITELASKNEGARTQRGQFLAPFSAWGLEDSQEDWCEFLALCGVSENLTVNAVRLPTQSFTGYAFHQRLEEALRLSKGEARYWKSGLGTRIRELPNPNTEYRHTHPIFTLPIAAGWENLSDEEKVEFAVHLIRALSPETRSQLVFEVFRPRKVSEQNRQQWPTPFAAFLNEAPWIPIQRAGEDLGFVRPASAWLFRRNDLAHQPRFLPLIHERCADALERNPSGTEILSMFGMKSVPGPLGASEAVEFLVQAIPHEGLQGRDAEDFEEIFDAVWADAKHGIAAGEGRKFGSIPVRNGKAIKALPVDGITDSVYFADSPDRLMQHVMSAIGVDLFLSRGQGDEVSWQAVSKVFGGSVRRLSETPLEISLDGVPFKASPDAPLLMDRVGAWLPQYLVCAAEFKGSSFFTRSRKTLETLRQALWKVRIRTARSIDMRFAGRPISLPEVQRGTMVVEDAVFPTVIVKSDSEVLSWDALLSIPEALSIAVKQRTLSAAFETALLLLRQVVGTKSVDEPTPEEIARALDVPVEWVMRTERDLQQGNQLLIPKLVAVLAAIQEGGESDQIDLEGGLVTDADVGAAVAEIERKLKRPRGELLSILAAYDLDRIRTELGLQLDVFNRGLRRLGPPYEAISYAPQHARALSAAVAAQVPKIRDSLRAAFLRDFDGLERLDQYISRKSMEGLIPLESWAYTLDDLSDDLIDKHINQWLAECGAPPMGKSTALDDLDKCHRRNLETVRSVVTRAIPIVRAWVAKHSPRDSADPWWGMEQDPRQKIGQAASAQGWLDFREIDDGQSIAWLGKYGMWPLGMPQTLDLAPLGLTEEEVAGGRAKADAERQDRHRRRSAVTFAGRDYSAVEDELMELVLAVENSYASMATLASADVVTVDLETLRSGRAAPRRAQSRNPQGKKGRPAASDDQLAAIGIVGECIAREWIKRAHLKKHQIQLTDDIWKSFNGGIALGSGEGDDSLGFDFRVQLKSVTYYYEVKASSGDPRMIELSANEVVTAQRVRRDAREKYRILYVANALNPAETQVVLLPNPFSSAGKEMRLQADRGLRFNFDWEDAGVA